MSSRNTAAADANTPYAESFAVPSKLETVAPVQTVGGHSVTGCAYSVMGRDGNVVPAASDIVVGTRAGGLVAAGVRGVVRGGFAGAGFVGVSARNDWDRSPERTVVPPLPLARAGSPVLRTDEVCIWVFLLLLVCLSD